MEEKVLDKARIVNLYNNMAEIWPNNDKWYCFTYKNVKEYICHFAKHHFFSSDYKIVNIGSAGNEYNLPGDHYHVDVAEEKIKNCKRKFVCSAENLPFNSSYFDMALCVGSVINYCDALQVVSEISRVLKKGAHCILDFEQSRSYQFAGICYNKPAHIIKSFNSGSDDMIWVYSEETIRSYCELHGFRIINKRYFHLISPLAYRICKDENKASKYACMDKFLNKIPFIRRISCNVILTMQKIS